MIKIAVLFALCLSITTTALAQYSTTFSGGGSFTISEVDGSGIILSPINCEQFEIFTDWISFSNSDSEHLCAHKWVYAEKSDVNERGNPSYTLAIDCASPCGSYPQ